MGRRPREKQTWTKNDLKENSQIVEEFYSIYFRSPTSNEFAECGGNLQFIEDEYHRYGNFLDCIGYPKSSRGGTLEVLDEDGEVIFTGTAPDIADEFDVVRTEVAVYAKAHKKLCKIYTLRRKPFNRELFLKHMSGEVLLYD